MDGVDEIVAEFLVESYENLDRLARELVQLEHEPSGRELLASIFRSVHTIKGTSGFLGFVTLERLAHAGESLLSRLRDGLQTMDPQIADALLAMSDAITSILQEIERSGMEGDADPTALVERLQLLQSDAAAPGPALVPAAGAAPATTTPPTPKKRRPRAKKPAAATTPAVFAAPAAPSAPASAAEPQAPSQPAPRRRVGEILIDSGLLSAEEITLAVHEQEMGDPRPLGEILAEHGVATEDEVDAIMHAHQLAEREAERKAAERAALEANPGDADPSEVPAAPGSTPAATLAAPGVVVLQPGARPSLSSATVRVDVRVLDELMNLVGELVLARNQIIEYNSGQRTPMAAAAQRLDLITTELQARVMTTRMQPIGSAWNRFPRLVRDVAAACGKNVRLELEGAETELDRSLIESVTDPLTHIVRNSVDHGIETPAERVARGKPPEGRLLLRAYHEDGQVHIEVRDDGAGIDPERVRSKAVEKGIITHDQALRMNDADALDLIFQPGFSTCDSITNISGRGVGMDVVKTNVENINGLLDIDSTVGVGTTLKIKIPLTLAIIPALVINCHNDRYAVPQTSVVELVRLQPEQARGGIEQLHGVPVYRLRGNLLPLVYLREQLGQPPHDADASVAIVVLAARDRLFGLVVDGVHNTEEIVVKPLARQLKAIPVYAGATIMGDGKVALILDVVGIALRSKVIADIRAADGAEVGGPVRHAGRDTTVPVVLVEGFAGERQAIPLTSVSRLEMLPRVSLERAFGRQVVQYDGGILPIVDVGELIGGGYDSGELDLLPTVVCIEGRQQFGLIVSRIVDIVELPQALVDAIGADQTDRYGARQPSPLVADGRVTELLDVGRAIRGARGDLFVNESIAARAADVAAATNGRDPAHALGDTSS